MLNRRRKKKQKGEAREALMGRDQDQTFQKSELPGDQEHMLPRELECSPRIAHELDQL
jgi:hypothetical protein